MSSRPIAVLLAGTAFLVGGSLPASAIEPEAAAKALAAALVKGSNVEATFESAELNGSDIVIGGFVVTRTAKDDRLSFEEIVIEAPIEGEKGVFQSPQITFTGGTLAGDVNGTIAAGTMTRVTVLDAAKQTSSAPAAAILYDSAEATELKFVRSGQPGEVTIDRIYVEAGNLVDDIPQDNSGSVEGIVLTSDLFPDTGFKPDTFGYDKLTVDLSWDVSRDIAASKLTINDFSVSIAEGGDLSLSGVIGDLPDPRALNDAGAESDIAKTKVHELSVRYDDHSLAGRVLDFLAQRQGLSRADYAQQIIDALPFLLIAINNPAFQEQVAGAVGGFLQNPQSLNLEIAPETPVSGDDLMALAKSEPGTIPDRLKASVTANTPE